MTAITLRAMPLTAAEFEPFGDVIETRGARHFPINAGTFERYHDLTRADPGEDGATLISIVTCTQASALPHRVTVMERHPLGSQAFMPLSVTPMVIVVAPPGDEPDAKELRAFVSDGTQGINYHRGTWHMPLIAMRSGERFLVVDRGGAGANCDEYRLTDEIIVDIPG